MPFVALDALSLIDPEWFDEHVLRPSLIALYLSQLIVFAVYPLYRRRPRRRRARRDRVRADGLGPLARDHRAGCDLAGLSRMNPWRAALTSATASGNSTRIASRNAIDCSSAGPAT